MSPLMEQGDYGPWLVSGVRTLIAIPQTMDSPLDLSTGTLFAPISRLYELDAVIPAGPWRKPTLQEIASLSTEDVQEERGSSISLLSVPKVLLQPFEPLRLAAKAMTERRTLDGLIGSPVFDRAIRSVMDYVSSCHCPSNGLGPTEDLNGGIYVRSPAECTVTTDPKSGRHVGLHVDNWNNYPIATRARAPNRITINLGCEDRFLLFVNVGIGTMYEKVQALVGRVRHTSAIGRVFLSLFSSYPVIRLRIRPGEAYVAPTENIVHDASTTGMTGWDITLSLRGHISLVPNDFSPTRKEVRYVSQP